MDPAQLQIDDFGLQRINFIPGLVGTYFGMLSFPWLLLLFGFLGFVFGRFERWLLRECTPARVILLAGAIASAQLYQSGLPTIVVLMRAAAVLAVVAKCAQLLLYGRRAMAAGHLRPEAADRLVLGRHAKTFSPWARNSSLGRNQYRLPHE